MPVRLVVIGVLIFRTNDVTFITVHLMSANEMFFGPNVFLG